MMKHVLTNNWDLCERTCVNTNGDMYNETCVNT